MSEPVDDAAILARMLELADRLAATDDEILVGQYAHLRARIAALAELQQFGAEPRA